LKRFTDSRERFCCLRLVCQELLQFAALCIIVAVCTRFHFPFFSARSYFADSAAPSRNRVGRAAVAGYVFRLKLDAEPLSPPFGDLLLSLKIIRLRRLERITLATVESTVGYDFRHDLILPYMTII